MAVAVALAVVTPLREGVGGLEGDRLRIPDPDPLGKPVGVAECVEERDSVQVLRGDREMGGLALALPPPPPPLPVAVVVEEVEGEGDTVGEAMVGM